MVHAFDFDLGKEVFLVALEVEVGHDEGLVVDFVPLELDEFAVH